MLVLVLSDKCYIPIGIDQIKSNQKSNRIESNRIESNRIK